MFEAMADSVALEEAPAKPETKMPTFKEMREQELDGIMEYRPASTAIAKANGVKGIRATAIA